MAGGIHIQQNSHGSWQLDATACSTQLTHGSWLNPAEVEIGIFSQHCLDNRRIPDLKTLHREALAWNRRINSDRVKIAGKFDRKTARRKFRYKRKSFTRSKT